MLAAGDIPRGPRAADELRAIAADFDMPWLRAAAGHAAGAVLLAEGDGRTAVDALRRAWTGVAGAGHAVRSGAYQGGHGARVPAAGR